MSHVEIGGDGGSLWQVERNAPGTFHGGWGGMRVQGMSHSFMCVLWGGPWKEGRDGMWLRVTRKGPCQRSLGFADPQTRLPPRPTVPLSCCSMFFLLLLLVQICPLSCLFVSCYPLFFLFPILYPLALSPPAAEGH